MKLPSLSPSEKKTISIAGAALLAGFLYFWGIKPYRAAMTAAKDELETAKIALSHEKGALITTRTNPNAQRGADSALAMTSSLLFEGRDDAIASSRLSDYLGDVARRSRVLLQDAGTRPSISSADGIRTLRVEIRAESDVQGVVAFLQALEGGTKLVRVDRLELSRTPGFDGKDGFETLNVAATVSGFAFGPSSAALDSASRVKPVKTGGAK